MDNKFIVNIGRQLGSGGREIGEKRPPGWVLTSTTRN